MEAELLPPRKAKWGSHCDFALFTHIENGTRVVVTATEEGILLKPVTAALIKRKAREPPMSDSVPP